MRKVSAVYRIGADIGGTFTDIIVVGSEGTIKVRKLLSTTENYSLAIIKGLEEIFQEYGFDRVGIEEVRHGTTIATNAVLQLSGAKMGLITTKGFRDILEIRQQRHKRDPESTYATDVRIPPPLIPRAFRLEVEERINYKGEILQSLDLGQVRSILQRLVDNGIESVAVCLLNSFVNPVHEQKIGELIRGEFSHLYLSLSSEVLPQIREYERTSTTVINSYIGPVVRGYLKLLEQELKNIGVTTPLLIMQSSGGVMSAIEAITRPMHIMESGPAAGVIASAHLAKNCGFYKVITLDMGGTTAKSSMIEDGNINRKYEFNVGGGITIGARWLGGAGYPLSVPSIDIAEVGAGGGSIVWVDKGGLMQVGPQSSGAMPGPACYDKGGIEPTVTDANVVLGYLNPDYLAGGSLRLTFDKAFSSLKAVAELLGLFLDETAYGAHLIANANMARAVKAVSSEQGKDPRDYTLFAFGGSGPVHAAELARSLGIKRVLVPLNPGLFSALGLVFAEVEHDFTQTFIATTQDIPLDDINQFVSKMEKQALNILQSEGYGREEITLQRFADLRYVGQSSELTIPIESGIIQEGTILSLEQSFFHEYQRIYGLENTGEPVEMVNLRLTAGGKHGQFTPFVWFENIQHKQLGQQGEKLPERKAYYGPDFGFLNTPILNRVNLSDEPQKGPIIIEEYDSTVVVPPRCKVHVDTWSNIIIEI